MQSLVAAARIGAFSKAPSTKISSIVTRDIQVRNISSKAIRNRINAVGNIKKITKAMKMVASSKLKRSQEALQVARAFAKGFDDVVPMHAKPVGDILLEDPPAEYKGKKLLVQAVGIDRGLCGSTNGQLNRAVKHKLEKIMPLATETKINAFGEKVKSSLERNFARQLHATVGDHTKIKRQTFNQAMALSEIYLKTDFEIGEIIHNRFKNLVSFETVSIPITPMKQMLESLTLGTDFELEGSQDIIENFLEFRTAVLFSLILAESETTELSQRVNAMTNSSKNATEMLGKLKLQYNRGRQAQITNELIEIISGAAAAEQSKKSM